ncbi:MAG: extracellular solute-binding protein [Clostridia bacterium]|nr:extracellular solute-binding protein [Clostridia bacterium]
MKKRQLTALLLAAVMLLGIVAGCKQKEDPQNEVSYFFEPTYHALDKTLQMISGNRILFDKTANRLYFIGNTNAQTVTETGPDGSTYEYETTEQKLMSVNLDGTDLKIMEAYEPYQLPEGSEGGANISAMAIAPDGAIWVAEAIYSYHYELPENFNPETDDMWNYYVDDGQRTVLRKLGSDGAEVQAIDVQAILKSLNPDDEDVYRYFYMNNFCFDADNNLYFSNNNSGVIVLNSQGAMIAQFQGDNMSGQVIRLGDGRLATISWGENGSVLAVLDLATKSTTEEIPLPTTWNNIYNGDDVYLYYYDSSISLMGYKNDGTTEKILDWLNSDIDQSNLSGFTVLSDECVVAMENDWDNQQVNLIQLNKTKVTPENRRTPITLAVMWLDWDLRREVLNFNRSNKEYRIEVRDYSEYNTQDDYSAGRKKLTTEIISGNVPDILYTSDLPINLYGAKGLLEDLMPYIEKDAELGGADALVTPVIEAMKDNGKLYYAAERFTITTAIANRRIVGDIQGWTVDEMKEALSRMPEGATVLAPYISQDNLLRMLCVWNMDEFINWETGKCSFDNGDFAKLLEFSALAPKTVPENIWEDMKDETVMFRENRQLLFPYTVSDIWDYFYNRYQFGEDAIYVGFPTADRSGNLFALNNGLAISAKCKSKDAAWQFVRTLLLPGGNSWGFALNKADFQKQIDDMKEENTGIGPNGETVRYPKFSFTNEAGEEIEIYAMSDEDEASFLELIQNTKKVQNYDENMLNIIMDAVAPFLDGEKTAEQTAAEVQNRVSLYVNEQR